LALAKAEARATCRYLIELENASSVSKGITTELSRARWRIIRSLAGATLIQRRWWKIFIGVRGLLAAKSVYFSSRVSLLSKFNTFLWSAFTQDIVGGQRYGKKCQEFHQM
jgi:hypothetical protein